MSFADSIATSHAVPAYCGARTYTILPTYPFLTISGTTLILTTSFESDVGVYSVDVTISLTNYPMVASITKTISITITCEVLALNFTSSPAASTTVQVGIDSQPLNIAFTSTQTPACGNSVNFVMTPSLTFLSLQNLTATGGNVQVNGATIANHATYTQTLTATVDG